jgi:Mrp family chromosome partitioning ATPase
MEHFIGVLKENFSYIVLDLPPITVVADALAVSGVLDGMLVVVEEGKTTKRELTDAMQRLEMIHDKILGFVITHAERTKGKYGKKYGKKYRYGYGYGYGYGGKRSESDPARSDSSDD